MGQLSALFYKNWILYKRSLLGNVLELLLPIFFIFFVLLVRQLELPIEYSEQSFLSNPLLSKSIQNDVIANAQLKYTIIHSENAYLAQWLGSLPTAAPFILSSRPSFNPSPTLSRPSPQRAISKATSRLKATQSRRRSASGSSLSVTALTTHTNFDSISAKIERGRMVQLRMRCSQEIRL
jgi:hypothetical protein